MSYQKHPKKHKHNTPQMAPPETPKRNTERDTKDSKQRFKQLKRTFEWFIGTFAGWGWSQTLELIGVVVLSAYTCLTYLLWHNSEAALRASQRAWVQLTQTQDVQQIDFKTLQRWTFQHDLVNTGHSPARDVIIEGNVEFLDMKQPPSLAFGPTTGMNLSGGILFPSAKPITIPISMRLDGPPVNDEQRSDFMAQRKYLVVYARVHYADDFGEHWTHLCWFAAMPPSEASARSCSVYNGAGDGPDPTR